jgi:hypothetical protein
VELLDGMRSGIPEKRGRIGSILMMKKRELQSNSLVVTVFQGGCPGEIF